MTDSSATHSQDSFSKEAQLAEILEAFEKEVREGHMPSVDQWAELHPDHAPEIRSLFPSLLLMEHTGSGLRNAQTGPPLPKKIGRFPILRELGRGGMGVVYLAQDQRLRRLVAVKAFQRYGSSDERFLERFFREARAAGGLSHPHIVPIFETGQDEGLPYYSMQYIEGSTLEECLFELRRSPSSSTHRRQGSGIRELLERITEANAPQQAVEDLEQPAFDLDWRECTRICREVGEALSHAHGKGILHRDVKPANVLLDHSGRAWISDFGLCEWEGEASMTKDGEIVGTLRYMAPEQLEGEPDERSDVYGLGLVLYELVTRNPAFAETRRGRLVKQILTVDPVRPRRIDPRIPKELETIVLKATAKLPNERYPSPAALVRDLKAFEEGQPLVARRPSAIYLASLLMRRHPFVTTAAILSLLLVALVAVAYTQSLRVEREQRTRGEYKARLAAAEAALYSGSVGRGFQQLEMAPEAYRGWEWRHLEASMDQSVATLKIARAYVRDIAFAPDGMRFAVASASGAHLLRIRSNEFEVIRALNGNFNSVVWHPDGHEFYGITASRKIFRIPVDSEEPTKLLGKVGAKSWVGTYYRDGRLLIGGSEGVVGLFDLDSGEWTVLGNSPGRIVGLEALENGDIWSMDIHGWQMIYPVEGPIRSRSIGQNELGGALVLNGEREALIMAHDGTLMTQGFEDHSRTSTFSTNTIQSLAVDVSTDGKYVAAGGRNKQIRIWRIQNREPIAVLSGQPDAISSLAWHPDGGRIIAGDERGNLVLWSLKPRGGRMPLGYQFHGIVDMEVSSDGQRMLSGSRDGSVAYWDLHEGEDMGQLWGHGSSLMNVGFVSNDQQALTIGGRGSLRLWDLASQQLLRVSDKEERPGKGLSSFTIRAADNTAFIISLPTDRKSAALIEEWDISSWQRERVWPLPFPGVWAIAFDEKTNRLICGTKKGEVVSIDVERQEVVWSLAVTDSRWGARKLEIDSASQQLLVVDWSQDVYLVDLNGGRVIRTFHHGEHVVHHADFMPDENRVVGGTRSGQVPIWDLQTGEHLTDIDTNQNWIVYVDASASEDMIVTGSSHGELMSYFTGKTLDRLRGRENGETGGIVSRLDFGARAMRTCLGQMRSGSRDGWNAAQVLGMSISERNEDVREGGSLTGAFRLFQGKPKKAIAALIAALEVDQLDPEVRRESQALLVVAYVESGAFVNAAEAIALADRNLVNEWYRTLRSAPPMR